MSDYLFVAEGVAPLDPSESAACALGLARALVGSRHRVSLLTVANPGAPALVPGLARRLRKVIATVGPETFEVALYEGRFSASDPTLYVLESAVEGGARRAALLASAALSLVTDGLLKADTVIGWGDVSATTLLRFPATAKLFVLPKGDAEVALPTGEADALHLGVEGDRARLESLADIGALAAHVVVVPSGSAARALERRGILADRPADEPLVAVRFGCDEPPNDPASDPALPARYSVDNLVGKAECRKQLGRKLSLALGARTLLLAVGGLRHAHGGEAVLKALLATRHLDIAVVVLPAGDRDLIERARIAAIENAAHFAVLSDATDESHRGLLAAADAVLLCDGDDLLGRPAGLALRYGTLPLAPAEGAEGEYLVDHDPRSETGDAVIYPLVEEADVAAAIARAVLLRADGERWARLPRVLMNAAPSWTGTAARFDALRATAEAESTIEAA